MPAAKTPKPAAYHHLAQGLRDLEADLRWGLDGSARIPAAWHQIVQNPGAPKKVPVTIRLDEDVAKFFRSMGAGHLPRMNAVLRTFMLARLAGVVMGAEDMRYAPSVEDEISTVKREIFAAVEAEMAAGEAALEERSEGEKRRARLEELKRLRDVRMARGRG